MLRLSPLMSLPPAGDCEAILTLDERVSPLLPHSTPCPCTHKDRFSARTSCLLAAFWRGPVQASEGDTWAERASALVFLQYFWFRHAFLLGPGGTAAVLEAVRLRLADAKLEVRELAALTLSGSAGRYQHG